MSKDERAFKNQASPEAYSEGAIVGGPVAAQDPRKSLLSGERTWTPEAALQAVNSVDPLHRLEAELRGGGKRWSFIAFSKLVLAMFCGAQVLLIVLGLVLTPEEPLSLIRSFINLIVTPYLMFVLPVQVTLPGIFGNDHERGLFEELSSRRYTQSGRLFSKQDRRAEILFERRRALRHEIVALAESPQFEQSLDLCKKKLTETVAIQDELANYSHELFFLREGQAAREKGGAGSR